MKKIAPRNNGPAATVTESSYSKSATGNPPGLGIKIVGIGIGGT